MENVTNIVGALEGVYEQYLSKMQFRGIAWLRESASVDILYITIGISCLQNTCQFQRSQISPILLV